MTFEVPPEMKKRILENITDELQSCKQIGDKAGVHYARVSEAMKDFIKQGLVEEQNKRRTPGSNMTKAFYRRKQHASIIRSPEVQPNG